MAEKIDPTVSCGFRKGSRTMKFLEYCHLVRIRAVRIVWSIDEEKMLVIVVRNPTKDAEWYLQFLHPDDAINEFVTKLVGELFLYVNVQVALLSRYSSVREGEFPSMSGTQRSSTIPLLMTRDSRLQHRKCYGGCLCGERESTEIDRSQRLWTPSSHCSDSMVFESLHD
ncbi:hypothetical protein NECAME_11954 [Necator americanus]|uniref:Uncharacterized protein n=1 Tax=Necator americanus TaxID=51031 RepID=W2T2D6_NECAM|nr:hypothetical protein NECAME_11954 [Necator americanus]ETN76063.1 hypothetical protein NECAME_11954 [Necator americanus]